jgi:hypothetical protein
VKQLDAFPNRAPGILERAANESGPGNDQACADCGRLRSPGAKRCRGCVNASLAGRAERVRVMRAGGMPEHAIHEALRR